MLQKYSEKATSPKKQKMEETKTEKDADSGKLRVTVGAHAYQERRSIERRAAASVKAKKNENETKQNKRNIIERQHDIRPEDTSLRHLWLVNYGNQTSTSPLALGYPLLGLPRHLRHTTACRSPALAFSSAIHFAMKRSAPCSAVLRHSPSS